MLDKIWTNSVAHTQNKEALQSSAAVETKLARTLNAKEDALQSITHDAVSDLSEHEISENWLMGILLLIYFHIPRWFKWNSKQEYDSLVYKVQAAFRNWVMGENQSDQDFFALGAFYEVMVEIMSFMNYAVADQQHAETMLDYILDDGKFLLIPKRLQTQIVATPGAKNNTPLKLKRTNEKQFLETMRTEVQALENVADLKLYTDELNDAIKQIHDHSAWIKNRHSAERINESMEYFLGLLEVSDVVPSV